MVLGTYNSLRGISPYSKIRLRTPNNYERHRQIADGVFSQYFAQGNTMVDNVTKYVTFL